MSPHMTILGAFAVTQPVKSAILLLVAHKVATARPKL